MMIQKIALTNFKAFDSEEFTIKPITLITGINGMGKSSIIQSLLLLKQNYELGFLFNQEKKLRLNHDFVNLESANDLCYALADEKIVDIKITDEDANSYHWALNTQKAESTELSYTYNGADINQLSLFKDSFAFLEAERWGPRATYNKVASRAYNTLLGIQGELTPAYLNKAFTNNENLGIEAMRCTTLPEGNNQLTENVNAWLSKIMNMPLKANTTELNKDQVKLEYGLSGSKGKKFSALQVGFGLTYSLPIIVALLRAHKGDLLIFENPEAHLHPSAQVELGKMMALAASSGIQILIESHSDHILNSLRLSRKEGVISKEELNVIFVQRDFGENGSIDITYITEIQITDEGKLSERPHLFFDTWDDVLTKLIE